MSYKDGTSSSTAKSLKGLKSSVPVIDAAAIQAVLSTSTISGATLENVSIYSGTIDDVIVGASIPSNATFANVTIGQAGTGGSFTVLGALVDSNGNPENYMSWQFIILLEG
jgi:hypothetical protein